MVNNVETLAAVPWIVARGGAAYARLGVGDSRGTKVVCLNERFRNPGAYEVELGIPLRRIFDELGGGLRDGHAAALDPGRRPARGLHRPAATSTRRSPSRRCASSAPTSAMAA